MHFSLYLPWTHLQHTCSLWNDVCTQERLDVFLMDLKRISMLFGGMMKQVFHWLPEHVWQFLCTSFQIEEMDISQFLAWVGGIMKVNLPKFAPITVAVKPIRDKGSQISAAQMRCYECNEPNHLTRNCLVHYNRHREQNPRLQKHIMHCFWCQECGHISRGCPENGLGRTVMHQLLF